MSAVLGMLAALGAGLHAAPREMGDTMWTPDLRTPRLRGRVWSPAAWAMRCERRRAEWVATMPIPGVNPRLDRGVLKVLAGERRARNARERSTELVVETHAAMKAGDRMYADEIARDMLEAIGSSTVKP